MSEVPAFQDDTISSQQRRSGAKINFTEAETDALTAREEDIFARLGYEGKTKPFSRFMDAADGAIISDEFGFSASPSSRHAQLQCFYRRVLVDMDGAFDRDRASFSAATSDGDAFLNALHRVPITRVGEPSFSAGEALCVFNKLIADPALYPSRARALLQYDSRVFVDVGIKEMGRKDTQNLSGEDTREVKEVTNGLYAALLYDILYGAYVNNPGFFSARDRYVAAKLAYQYQDEVIDVVSDAQEGSANLITAYSGDLGESAALRAAFPQLVEVLPKLEEAFANPLCLVPYYSALHRAAPRSYTTVVIRQRELLDMANLPPEVVNKIRCKIF